MANIIFDLQNGGAISGDQVSDYSQAFGFPVMAESVARVQRLICKARAAACREATARLSWGEDESDAWIDAALRDDAPFAFERSKLAAAPDAGTPVPSGPTLEDEPTPPLPVRPKMSLIKASEEAIADHQKDGDWDTDTVKQVRTAIRLFDYACGTGIMIEDLEQSHVRAFTKLCAALPNRWGRTREERADGFEASLARAATLPASEVGLGQVTINKHLTWVTSVLDHAAGEDGDETGHRPAVPLLFKTARKGAGKGPRKDRKRKRDKRANWTKAEVARLLSAPIWTGAKGIDHRLTPGTEIIHDAWYWLPLMLPLYGGRSSELAGLGLAEVHEQDPIPYFVIDYTEDRPLKNVQSIRKLPIHPELIRLGFIDYITKLRRAGCTMLFPEMVSADSPSFAGTFYKTVFIKLRRWAFPEGTAEIVAQLRLVARADDDRRHGRPPQQPVDGDLRHGLARLPRHRLQRIDDAVEMLVLDRRRELDRLVEATARRDRPPPPDLAGQPTQAERAPDHCADALIRRQWHQIPFVGAADQRVIDLMRNEARPAMAVGECLRLHDLPAGIVGNARIAHLPVRDQAVERAHHLLGRSGGVEGVKLEQVDPVGTEPP